MLNYSIPTRIDISNDGVLGKYLEKARPLSVEERGKLLETDPEFSGTHEQVAEEGQTNAHSNEPVFPPLHCFR